MGIADTNKANSDLELNVDPNAVFPECPPSLPCGFGCVHPPRCTFCCCDEGTTWFGLWLEAAGADLARDTRLCLKGQPQHDCFSGEAALKEMGALLEKYNRYGG